MTLSKPQNPMIAIMERKVIIIDHCNGQKEIRSQAIQKRNYYLEIRAFGLHDSPSLRHVLQATPEIHVCQRNDKGHGTNV